jgi:Flp pilus assembly protein TadD/transglutaminase-like putative cysteine protease
MTWSGSVLPVLTILAGSWLSAQQPAPHSASSSNDEGFVVEQSRTLERFESDGTGRREVYFRIKTQSEAGVQQWGQVVLGYNAANERMDIPFVRVTKPSGAVIQTPSDAVQDISAPVQRIAPVYTDFREKHVTVQALRPGDTLEFSVVTTIHTALAPGQFWTEYAFNDEAVVLDEQFDLDVPASKKITLKCAPGYEATPKDEAGRRLYHWSHSHPVREDPETLKKKEKERAASDEPERAPIRLTTFANWGEVGNWFAGLEAASRVATPEVREKAQELTKDKKTDLEKLQALYDYVSKNFRYVSLSLGAGRYQPRPAADVLHDAYGDCKDKHTLLATLIDAAGLHASAVLINSGVKLDPEFPSPSQFDHVITRAVADGRPVWLDATPEVAPFGLILFPLRDKQALLIAGASSHLERTPAASPVPNAVTTAVEGAIDDEGTLTGDVRLTFRGDTEVQVRTIFRLTAEANWKSGVEEIAKRAGLDGKVSDVRVSDPQATKDPFSIAFHLVVPAYANWEAGQTQLAPPFAQNVLREVPDGGTITLGPAGTSAYTLKLRVPEGAVLRPPVAVSVARDYGEYHASYTAADHTFSMDRTSTVTKSELAQSRRDDYVAFLGVMRQDQRQRLSVESAHVAASSTAAPSTAEAKTLGQRGYDALSARDYEQAVALLKRAVELDAKDKYAWNNLGLAYAGLRDMPSAIQAYKKQIEVNPYDQFAYDYLGLAYVQQRDYTDAEAAYVKQLEINPLDRYASGYLGQMYNEEREYTKAAVALEKAVGVQPTNASYQVQLGKAYLNAQQHDKALAAFDKAAELSPSALVWNDVAYELALARVDLDRAQRYAESAVMTLVAMSRNVDVNHANAAALGTVEELASYWDTLGWVFYARGDLAKAERYVSASWALSAHAEVGDHLGQICEKRGRRGEAEAAFARALGVDRPDPSVREHLAALAGADAVDALVRQHRDDVVTARRIPIRDRGPAGKAADFFLALSAPDRVDSVHFISGDAGLRALVPALQRLRVNGMFPDDQPERLLRRITVSCATDGRCTATLIPPHDAKPER